MFLIVIGLLLLVAGFAINSPALPVSRYSRPVKIAGIVIALVGALTASIRQIDAGTVGVQSLFGKVSSNVLETGLNFVNPLVEVVVFDTKTQNYTCLLYTTRCV